MRLNRPGKDTPPHRGGPAPRRISYDPGRNYHGVSASHPLALAGLGQMSSSSSSSASSPSSSSSSIPSGGYTLLAAIGAMFVGAVGIGGGLLGKHPTASTVLALLGTTVGGALALVAQNQLSSSLQTTSPTSSSTTTSRVGLVGAGPLPVPPNARRPFRSFPSRQSQEGYGISWHLQGME